MLKRPKGEGGEWRRKVAQIMLKRHVHVRVHAHVHLHVHVHVHVHAHVHVAS